FVPRSLTPAPRSVIRAESGSGIHPGSCSVCYKVQIGAAEKISCCPLQSVTDASSKGEKPDRWRKTFSQTTQNQIQINAHKDQMVGDAINTRPLRLTVRVKRASCPSALSSALAQTWSTMPTMLMRKSG